MQQESGITRNFRSSYKIQSIAIVAYVIVCLWLYIAEEGEMTIIVCPSKLIYGLPCPGCGVTRAILMAFHGDLIEALAYNPNCLFAIVFVFVFPIIIGNSILKKKNYTEYIYNKVNEAVKNKFVLITLLLMEVCIWIHNVISDI